MLQDVEVLHNPRTGSGHAVLSAWRELAIVNSIILRPRPGLLQRHHRPRLREATQHELINAFLWWQQLPRACLASSSGIIIITTLVINIVVIIVIIIVIAIDDIAKPASVPGRC